MAPARHSLVMNPGQKIGTIITCLLAASASFAAEYHVAPAGSDKNPGSAARPFATIQKAADVMVADDTCIVHAGTYRETVTPRNDGKADAPIVFQAGAEGRVTIDGSDVITGWERHAGAIYKARMTWDLGRNNQVFFDGKIMDEARWPNDSDGDLLTADGAKIGPASTPGAIRCGEFPNDWKAGSLRGAVAWVMAQSKWSSWTAPVTGYDPADKKLLLDAHKGWWVEQRHSPAKGGSFYLTGAMCLLDKGGEWHYDSQNQTIYIQPPDALDVGARTVTAKRRMLAFDLSGRRFVHVVGFNIHAATIDMTDAEHCLVKNIRAKYISHTRGGKTVAGIGEKTGIHVSGMHNTIRDSEIAFSAGSGVVLAGRRNAVINCYIRHTDYLGCYAAPINMGGIGHLISHNTIHDTGRDCIKLGGAEHLIQHNDIHRPGRLCHDLGAIYSGALDGGNTVIRYNWVHDNPRNVGIYLDNYMKNFIVHHNVVWKTANSIRLNRPTGYCMIFHNSVFGDINNSWGPWKGQYVQFGSHVLNNVTGRAITMNDEVPQVGNALAPPMSCFDAKDRVPTADRPGWDRGVVILGINDDFKGSAPDSGAFESGAEIWRAGHDFTNPPEPVYETTRSELRNYIRNAAFEYGRYQGKDADPFEPWVRTHSRQAKIEFHPGFNNPPAEARNSVNGNSLTLTGRADDGIEQHIAGLRSETSYILAAYVRLDGAKEVELGVRGAKGTVATAGASSVKLLKGQAWRHVRVPFETGPGETSATVYILKKGPGTAYVDDTGLVPAALIKLRGPRGGG